MALAQLTFGQTLWASFLNAAFTAVLVGIAATIVVKWFESRRDRERHKAEVREAKDRQEAEQLHDARLQRRDLEYQTRASLRETYALLLIAQRQSRAESFNLAHARAQSRAASDEAAEEAHTMFIGLYHRLNLDASTKMWRDARALRSVLDDMLEHGRRGDIAKVKSLVKVARSARQNLEGSFRRRLNNPPLQSWKPLGPYDKRGKASVGRAWRRRWY